MNLNKLSDSYFPLEANSPRVILCVCLASNPDYKIGRFPLEPEVLLVSGMMINGLFLPISWITKHFTVYEHLELLLWIINQTPA